MKLTNLLSCAALAALTATAAGCGGSTRTVSVSGSPPSTTAAQSTSTATAPSKAPAHTAPATTQATTSTSAPSTSQSGGTPAQTGAGSSHEPAFVGQGSGAAGMDGAVAVMRSRGYAPVDLGQYRSGQTLNVLVGSRQGSGHAQQAFFFVGGHYLGTDTRSPSAQIRVVDQSDTEVTLAYGLYRQSDSACCPSGGEAHVRYQLDNGHLTALDPIPAISATSAAAGRQ